MSGEVANRDISAAGHFLTPLGLANSSAKLFPAGSVLVAMYGATAGEVGILQFEAATNQAVCAVYPSQRHISEYLYYYLLHVKPNIVAQAVGNAQPNISQAKVKATQVPLPPLEEQKRIVAVLDQTFAALNRARTHAETNLADTRELFGTVLNAVVKRRSSNQQKKLRLGLIVTRLTNGYVGPTRNIYVDTGVPYLLARHVRDNTLTFDGKTYISRDFNDKHEKSKLKSGDVLLVQSGHIGHCAVVPDEHDEHNCHAMIVISPINEVVSGYYLSMMFNTPLIQDAFQRIRTGSTVPHLTCKMVKELMVDIPPRPIQDRIMLEAEQLRLQIETARKRYEADIEDIADLRQSILQKAFAGELS